MNIRTLSPMSRLAVASAMLALSCPPAAYAEPPVAASRVAAGPAAHSVILEPVGGGLATAVPIGAGGAFNATGLAPGRYRLRVATVTVPRQTQGASFGEKVAAGLHATGAQASVPDAGGGNAGGDAASVGLHKQNVIHRDLAARMATSVSLGGGAATPVDVDGGGFEVTITGGAVAGVVVAAVTAQE